jgi:hypothetical protein
LDVTVRHLTSLGYHVCGAVILLAAGRPLPDLAAILRSHALLHTAEGEFFRNAFRCACERLQMPARAIRERDLGTRARERLGSAAPILEQTIAGMGRTIGPPWAQDQRIAALAASLIL